MITDPRRTLADSPMTVRQWLAVVICILLNALDGFDVLSISFASPGIAKDWGIERGALGVVLSIELVGMMVGSVVLGQVADRAGRRPTTLLCLVLMATGMLATTQVHSIGTLAACRLLTGLGIGGMLTTTTAMVAEFANARWRGAAMAMMVSGYPLGGIVGGAIASDLLVDNTWRSVFWLGGAMTAALLPLVLVLVPEPVGALIQRRPADVLSRVNASLRGLGHATVEALPEPEPSAPKAALSTLFSGSLGPVTILLTAAYFLHIMTFYFILKWVPKIVVDMGFAPSSAGGVLVWANVGGLTGGLMFGLLSLKVPLRRLLAITMVASAIGIAMFGRSEPDLRTLAMAAAIGGFCANAGVVGIYALVAASFPTTVRAGGTGIVIGVGRGGAVLGPIIAGLLFESGLALSVVAAVMALGSLFAVGALAMLPRREAQEV